MEPFLAIDVSRANEEEKTGVGWYSYHLIEALKKAIPQNIKVVLYTREPLKGALSYLPKNWNEKIVRGIAGRLWTQVGLVREMRTTPPRVFFTPSHVLPFFMPRKVKATITIHDIGAFRVPDSYTVKERFYLKFTTHHAVKRADCLITPTQFTKDEIVGVFGQDCAEKIKVVHSGYAVQASMNYKSNGFVSSQPYIFYIGRLEQKKRTLFLVEAFHRYIKTYNAKEHLVLAGHHGFGFHEVEKCIKENNLHDRVHLLGYVEQGEILNFYQNAKLFIFPSAYEGFGLPILESFFAGTPVLASAQPALMEVGGDGAVFESSYDQEKWARRIHDIISDTNLCESLIVKGKERLAKFSWGKSAQEIWLNLQHFFS